MSTYIDRIVTEVAVMPETPEGGERTDTRWAEARKVEALVRMRAREAARTRAEGRDD